ncbi:DUF4175 domain-containing protein [Paracoccus sp. p3-h83]|uniref:DUF4175 domain-containing protein n=1 Tax=Paracoccus sp. p3-h83 TaxID=3342805 RepID=UPI0035BB75F0
MALGPATDLTPDPAPGGWPIGAIRATRRALWLDQIARAFWPLAALIALIAAALAFGVDARLPGWARWVVLACITMAAIWGLARLRPIPLTQAEARLDASLPGRPLAGLRDSPVLSGGTVGDALWAAHRQRLAAQAAQARPLRPRPDLAPRDPFALRLVALLALAMALVFGQPARLIDLTRQTLTAPRPAPAQTARNWEGWATPPAHTGKPTIYLNRLDSADLTLPQGSKLAFRLYGEPGAVALDQTLAEDSQTPEPGQVTFTADRSGLVRVDGQVLNVTVTPDQPPHVALGDPAERRADGRLAQPFAAGDDHAVVGGQVTIALDLAAIDRRFGLAIDPEPRDPLVLDLPLPAARSRQDFTGSLTGDAAEHAFANLPVVMQATVRDGLDQTGQSAALHLILPGRRFFDPLAAALIEQRRDLLWSRANAPRVAQILRAITHHPEGFLTDQAVYLLLRSVIRRIEAEAPDLTADTRDQVAGILWDAAVTLEDGGLSDALDRMQRAQERLSEAIRQGASPDEIQRLMQELRQATQDYTRMLAERDETDPAERFARQPQSQPITGDQIQQMMDEIQRLMNEGKMAEAQALLDQFNRMMQNLRVTQNGQGGDPAQGDGAPGSMQDLGQTLRRQQDLADQAFRSLQDSYRPYGQPPDDGSDRADPGDLADRQRDLRRELGRSQGMLPGRGTAAGDGARQALEDAGRAMDEAEQALRGGDPGGAIDRQAEAIQSLRDGMRQLGEALAARPAPGERMPADQQGSPDQQGQARDPLGRAIGQGGPITTPDALLPDEIGPGRARQLMDEIRRRAGEQTRPPEERGYLRRLLDNFP